MGNPHSNHIIPPHIDFQNHLVKSERDAELSADTIPFDYVHRHRLQHFQCVNDANRCEELVEQIISAAHYESKGNGEMRRHCRNEAIGALTEILTRRVTVSTNLFSKD